MTHNPPSGFLMRWVAEPLRRFCCEYPQGLQPLGCRASPGGGLALPPRHLRIPEAMISGSPKIRPHRHAASSLDIRLMLPRLRSAPSDRESKAGPNRMRRWLRPRSGRGFASRRRGGVPGAALNFLKRGLRSAGRCRIGRHTPPWVSDPMGCSTSSEVLLRMPQELQLLGCGASPEGGPALYEDTRILWRKDWPKIQFPS